MKDEIVLTILLVIILIMTMIVYGCGGSQPVPPPPPATKQIVLAWEPGSCAEQFHIYRTIGERREMLGTTTAATWSTRMVPVQSQWQVSGWCGEVEHASEVVELRP